MHSFGDWLRQIKGNTGKKRSARARQCSLYVVGMGGRRRLVQKGKETVNGKEESSTCVRIKGELNRAVKSLFNSDLEKRGVYWRIFNLFVM